MHCAFHGFLVDIVDNFSVLWEASHEDERWDDCSRIALGVRKSSKGRVKKLSASYQQAVSRQVQSAAGKGLRCAGQLLIGAAAGQKRSQSFHLRMKNSFAAKSQRLEIAKNRGDKSEAARMHRQPSNHTGKNIEMFERFNYFYESRRQPAHIV